MKLIIFAAFLVATAVNASANDLAEMGCSRSNIGSSKELIKTSVVCDSQEIAHNLDKMRASGVLNEDVNFEFFRKHPFEIKHWVLCAAVAESVRELFGAGAKSVSVVASLRERDDFGSAQDRPVLKFSLDKKTASKIDWDHFNPTNFDHIARDFSLSPWAYQQEMDEFAQNKELPR